ncbi:hypothetical protein BB561_004070 [Smittium simulii]|uniref:Oxidase FUB9 n=1 Tax=Smittium simulii TaxID=133385 RepID=A0A2T9YI44_9FUNG|nr:hypothetical protein BB561_004070 [Smittium simulii]
MAKISSIQDLQEAAKAKLSKGVYDYYSYGAMDMITVADNSNAYNRYQIRPRVLRDVSKIDTGVEVFGKKYAYPIFVAATALQKLADVEGEVASARATTKNNLVYSLSSISTSSIEEVADGVSTPNLWFQLSVFKDKHYNLSLIRRAEKAGYKAILVTVDMPYSGRRLPEFRQPLTVPEHLTLKNLTSLGSKEGSSEYNKDSVYKRVVDNINSAFTWEDLKWLKQQTKLPMLAKGILNPRDAELVVLNGLDGIIVSNHGGRQLDGVSSTIDALPNIVDAVGGKIPVFVDGGIRRGTDVFKALAFGAQAVFVGRPNLYGLAYGGQKGVELMLNLLFKEFELAMALAGCSSLKDINRSYIQQTPQLTCKL